MAEHKRFTFWADDPGVVTKMIGLTVDGKKTATARPLFSWGVPAHDWDAGRFTVGDICTMYDLERRPQATIRITEVYEFRFGDIPERLWRGENCASADAFKADHHRGWSHLTLADDTPLIAIHYEITQA